MSARQPLADIQFISDFAAFCRTKGDEGYDYCSPWTCALSQFLRGTGRALRPSCSFSGWSDLDRPELGETKLPAGLDDFEMGGSSALHNDGADWRFDLLALRLEALLIDAPTVERG